MNLYLVSNCILCKQKLIQKLYGHTEYYYCPALGFVNTHFSIGMRYSYAMETFDYDFAHLKLDKFTALVHILKNETLFVNDITDKEYRRFNRTLSYDEILRYHEHWLLS